MMNVNYLDTESGTILQDELRDWSQAALNQLDKAYGYKSFRPGQLEAVNAILNRRDLIAVMPTGSGKSVCYQLPALRVGSFTVVVSPLRALMRDQMQALQARGVPAARDVTASPPEASSCGLTATSSTGGTACRTMQAARWTIPSSRNRPNAPRSADSTRCSSTARRTNACAACSSTISERIKTGSIVTTAATARTWPTAT